MAFGILHSIGLNERSDEELLDRYKATSNQKWISQLFGRYVTLIYGVCLRYTPDAREAEDWTMEIYQKIVDKALTHQIKSFKSWLYVVSKNYCLEQIRKRTGKPIAEFDQDFVQLQQSLHLTDEKAANAAKEQRFVWLEACLDELTNRQKRSIRLFYYENKSYKEIADIIEDQVSQVRSHLQNGRRKMKQCVERKQRNG